VPGVSISSQCWSGCEDPGGSDTSKLNLLAWCTHVVDKKLNNEAMAAVPAPNLYPCKTMQRQFIDRARFARVLQKNNVAVPGMGVSGFAIGPMPDPRPEKQKGRTPTDDTLTDQGD
jgi:hypothetical protein